MRHKLEVTSREDEYLQLYNQKKDSEEWDVLIHVVVCWWLEVDRGQSA